MIENKKKDIALDKYNSKIYEEYVYMLSEVLQYYAKLENTEMIEKYCNYILEVKNIIETVKSNTSNLAKKLQDSSEIVLDENVVNYIEETELLKNMIVSL